MGRLDEWANGGAIDRWAFGGYDLPIRLRVKERRIADLARRKCTPCPRRQGISDYQTVAQQGRIL